MSVESRGMPFAQVAGSVDVSMLDSAAASPAVPPVTGWREWPRSVLPIVAALILLAMGVANIVQRAASDEVEDGALWVERSAGVVAAEVAADSPAEQAGVRPSDILLAIDGRPVTTRDDVLAVQTRGRAGDRHRYTLLRLGTREVAEVRLAPLP